MNADERRCDGPCVECHEDIDPGYIWFCECGDGPFCTACWNDHIVVCAVAIANDIQPEELERSYRRLRRRHRQRHPTGGIAKPRFRQ